MEFFSFGFAVGFAAGFATAIYHLTSNRNDMCDNCEKDMCDNSGGKHYEQAKANIEFEGFDPWHFGDEELVEQVRTRALSVSKRVVVGMQRLGLTRHELAEKSGINEHRLSAIMLGEAPRLDLVEIQRLQNALGMPILLNQGVMEK